MAKANSFVDQLITDPGNIPDMILLNGFEGKSSMEGYTRLYLNAVLNEYYEIPQEAVLHAVSGIASAAAPLASTYLWLKGDAELIRKGKSIADRKTKFLAGDIQSGQAAAKPAATPDAPVAAPLDGPTGVQNCTQAPPVCGDTAWKGCPA
ncbi:MAG: hypothetical protein WC091_14605 [Sulfuricellaceae bacterium]